MRNPCKLRICVAFSMLLLLGVVLPLSTREESGNRSLNGEVADKIIVEKSTHTMTLYANKVPFRTYKVALGRGGLEPKVREGDNRVPEGKYRITSRNAKSRYHRALRIGYPTPEQKVTAEAQGIDPGGDIMIHGIRNGLGWLGRAHRIADWTKGCIAVTDDQIEEIWGLVPDGTPIEIRP